MTKLTQTVYKELAKEEETLSVQLRGDVSHLLIRNRIQPIRYELKEGEEIFLGISLPGANSLVDVSKTKFLLKMV